jgi:hypothetical protein
MFTEPELSVEFTPHNAFACPAYDRLPGFYTGSAGAGFGSYGYNRDGVTLYSLNGAND